MPTRWEVEAVLARLRSGSAQLAAELLELDALVDRQLGDPPRLHGRTAEIATDARRRLVGFWETHGAINALLTAAAAERGEGPRLGGRRVARLAALLAAESSATELSATELSATGATPIAVGRAGPAGPADARQAAPAEGRGGQRAGAEEAAGGTGGQAQRDVPAQRRLDDALAGVRDVRAAVGEVIAARARHRDTLAPLARQLSDLLATAERIGVAPGGATDGGPGDGSRELSDRATDGATDGGPGGGDVPELATARAALALAQAAVAADPVDVPAGLLSGVGEALAPAAETLAALVRAHDHLVEDLEAAGDLLARVVAVAQAGERHAREAVERVTGDADGLLRLADGWFDAPRRGLRPWLDRLAAAGEAGDWRLVAYGLPAWRRTAEATLATAAGIVQTNASPARRRDELRGLLRALRAKAGRTGLLESAELEARYAPALAALGSAPIDLDRAEVLVRAYAAALLAAGEASGGPGWDGPGGDNPGRYGERGRGTDGQPPIRNEECA
ncbi:hypothetical protein [Frankia sp. QA3]|uniref:hypothetical protein n=1 Tax=Frankia sp. QA3 TaxID=710111 RepID=UPI000269BDD3|nr:hypothetical protein [Frankia sp. QA3]EIV92319.1 hypothetical protein FraQA3DRAFT_1859 [Frankia sp. QA3]